MTAAQNLISKAVEISQRFEEEPEYKSASDAVDYGWAKGVIDLANQAKDYRVEGAYNEREAIVHWLRELARVQKGDKEMVKLLHTLAGRVERADHLEVNKPKTPVVERVQRPKEAA